MRLSVLDRWLTGRFLRAYVYIALGGNRRGERRRYANVALTMLLGGLWHGAGWTFVFWGFLHGAATVVHRIWTKLNIKLPRAAAWFLTFECVPANVRRTTKAVNGGAG